MTHSEITQFEKENIDRIIDMKVNQCVEGVHFVYLHEDGDLRLGRMQDYGHSALEMYGGECRTREEAKKELEYFFNQR